MAKPDLSFTDGFTIGSARALAAGKDNAKVFDWDKAAKLILLNSPARAEAGLDGDWPSTGGPIWEDGKPIPAEETYTYLASNWATPQLRFNDGQEFDCWILCADSEWDSGTYWPESALKIIQENAKP